MTEASTTSYPVRLEIEYPERQSRWRALLRLPLSIPLLTFLYLLSNAADLAIIAAILVRGRIPRWLFEFRVSASRWIYRAGAYVLLLTDEYAPFEGDYAVSYDVTYPDKLSRWKLLVWKFITSVPHVFVVAVLTLTLIVVVPIGWFAILFTGSFPRGLHGYVTGVLRWGARVNAYAFSLTDEFPPFSLSADAGSGGTSSYTISAVTGVLATGGVIAGIVAVALLARGEDVVTQVSYERLRAREVQSGETFMVVDGTGLELTGVLDPADDNVPYLQAKPGHRLVVFDMVIATGGLGGISPTLQFSQRDFRLVDSIGDKHDPFLAVIGGRIPPFVLEAGFQIVSNIIFEVPNDIRPAELRYNPGAFGGDTAVYEFR